MPNKKFPAVGRVNKGFPVFALSSERLSEMGFLKKKVSTDQFITESDLVEIHYPEFQYQQDAEPLIREAIIAATASPFLRATVAFFLTRDQASIKVIQSAENSLTPEEYMGVLLLAYNRIAQSPHRGISYFREANATHMIHGGEFADALNEYIEPYRHAEMLIINVNHDYLSLHYNLSHLGALLQVIRQTKSAKKA
jgi:hypothetical protein